jgi:serpin B
MRIVVPLSSILLTALVGCGNRADLRVTEESTETDPTALAVEASNAFAVDLLRTLSAAEPERNLAFSPYSISTGLAMALEGARGDTADEMGRTLRLPTSLRQTSTTAPWKSAPYGAGLKSIADRLTPRQPNQAEKEHLADLWLQLGALNRRIENGEISGAELDPARAQADKLAKSINKFESRFEQFDLRVANALWGEKTYPFDPRYLADIDRLFGTGSLRLADFRDNYPDERLKINRWVAEQTDDHISDLLPTLTPTEYKLLRLVLVNAIFFKGQWSEPFAPRSTVAGKFNLPDGNTAPAKLMRHEFERARYAVFRGDPKDKPAFSIVELPFTGDRLAMTFLAPECPDGLPAIESALTGPTLAMWIGKLKRCSVDVTLPRFKLESDLSLADPLKKMGMPLAFTKFIADFTAMSTADPADDRFRLYISKVLHKASVEVNEQGAEAAAATAVMMLLGESRKLVPTFRADRPFLFLIRDTESGMILFMGRVSRPG